MRDLDGLRTALRDEADALPVVALLPAVRSGAHDMRRRRLTSVAIAVVAVLAVVSGIGYATLGRPSRTVLAGAGNADVDPGDLIGPTWTLTSWTTAAGAVVRPTTDRPPTLVFDSQNAAHSDDPVNTTTWTVRLSSGEVSGVSGGSSLVSETTASAAAEEALSAVLSGPASWAITDTELVIRSSAGRSVTYTKAPASTATAQADNFFLVVGRTWALTSASQGGRTWRPKTPAPPTLEIWSGGGAQEDDGSNNAEWSVVQSGSTLTWTKIWSTGVGRTAATRQVDLAVAAILVGRTSWSVAGDSLVITGADGNTLAFNSSRATPVVGHAAVSLAAVHGCGLTTCGHGLVAGSVTIANQNGTVVWRMSVTTRDGGNDVLQAGTYVVTATIADGLCAPATVTLSVGHSTPVTVSCRDGLSSD